MLEEEELGVGVLAVRPDTMRWELDVEMVVEPLTDGVVGLEEEEKPDEDESLRLEAGVALTLEALLAVEEMLVLEAMESALARVRLVVLDGLTAAVLWAEV